jgi:diacylglycerol kinase (ATP)
MKPDWLVIVNPNAGMRKGKKDWKTISKLLGDKNISYEFVTTTHKYHAIALAKEGIEAGYRKIIAVGGDGTLNEVANGILSQQVIPSSEIKLGMITVGTGNDWAKMYKIPGNYKAAISIIAREKSSLQDVGKVSYFNNDERGTRFFVNVAGMGFDAQVALKTNNQKEKGQGNAFSYLINIFSTLLSHREKQSEIIIDGKSIKAEVFSMNVGICRYNGGGMMQTPNAVPDDGLLDVTIIRKVGRFYVVRNVKKLYDGSFIKLPEVSTHQGKNVHISGPKRIYLEVDGESLGHSPFEFDILPKAINVIVP